MMLDYSLIMIGNLGYMSVNLAVMVANLQELYTK